MAIGLKEVGVILSILIMDAVFSADNSLAINAMVLDLPPHMRKKAMYLGMTVAALLRLVALACVAYIMANPWTQILGGLYLIKLCWDHFRKEAEEAGAKKKHYASFASVLFAIGMLDLSLSLDNVIAVVAMSPNLAVIWIGVLASIALLVIAAVLVQGVLKRYPTLEPAAYLILAFLGMSMIAHHFTAFVFWVQESIVTWHDVIAHMHYEVGETTQMVVIAGIITTAIVVGEFDRRKKRRAEHAHKHAHTHTAPADEQTH